MRVRSQEREPQTRTLKRLRGRVQPVEECARRRQLGEAPIDLTPSAGSCRRCSIHYVAYHCTLSSLTRPCRAHHNLVEKKEMAPFAELDDRTLDAGDRGSWCVFSLSLSPEGGDSRAAGKAIISDPSPGQGTIKLLITPRASPPPHPLNANAHAHHATRANVPHAPPPHDQLSDSSVPPPKT